MLLTVVQQLSSIPGRKTIVFFSEGLPVSPALSARLDYVIDVANRANVTAYAVDAKGLRSKSLLTNARKEMDDFAEERLNQVTTGSDRTEQPLTMAFERVEDTLRLDSRTGLARLSEETGGFLIEQTNDLSSAFRRIDEDNQLSLPAHLLAEEHGVRRQVPRDSGEGPPPGPAGVRAQGISRDSRGDVGDGRQLRSSRPRAARSHAASECVSRSRPPASASPIRRVRA